MHRLTAKLARPHLAEVIERVRLYDLLDGLSRHKIIWISAPAGSGKTTLIASWLDARKLSSLWYQADEGDSDIATFFSFLGTAVRQAAPRHRAPLPHYTPEYRSDRTTFTKRYFRLLFARLKTPFAVVIDNYQDVPTESEFHEVVNDAFSLVPQGLTIVVASRANPPAQLSRLIANGQLAVIGWSDMKFTLNESQELVEQREKKKRTENDIRELYRKTEGWAAGLVLLAESSSASNESAQVPAERVFDYFAAELFKGANQETQRFLLMTAFLRTMTAGSAAELTGNRKAEKILSHLSRTNFFTERRAVPEITYQYHPLFREFLQLHANEYFSSEDLPAVKKKAAAQLRSSGMPEEAARLLIELADWQGLTGLVLENGRSFIAEGRFLTLGTWIYKMPPELVEQNGWLLYWKAMCRLAGRPAEARAMLERSYAIFHAAGDASGAFMCWSGIVETFIYEWKNFQPLDQWISQFRELLRRYNGFPSREIEEQATSAIFTALMFRQPQHPELPHWIDRVQHIMHTTDDFSRRMFIGYNLILYYLWTGRITQAGSLVSLLAPLVKRDRAAPLPALMWYRTESLFHLYAGQHDAGLNTVDEGLRLAGETGVHHLDLMFFGTGIYLSGMKGETGQAMQALCKMAESLGQRGCFEESFFVHQASFVALLAGELDSALQLGERCMGLYRETESPLLLGTQQYVLMNILMEAGQHDQLRVHIAELRDRDSSIRTFHYEGWCLVFEAAVALREGNENLFAECFRRATAIFLKSGIRIVVILRKTLSLLCAKALELGIETDFVKDLIKLYRIKPEEMPYIPESWPWPVKIYTLGRFEVYVNDEPIVFTGRVQKKPLELLKAIIAFGGRNVPVDQITDALWFEADGDAAKTSFDTTLHRLRKMIGLEKAIILQDGMLSLNERYCWVDVWSFETVVRNENEIEKAERAVALYHGHFLPAEMKQPWTISLRERLRHKFAAMVIALGLSCEIRQEYGTAAGYYRKGLEIDNLCEEFYQRLMLCFQRQGQETEVLKIYQGCRAALQSGLGILPSTRTEEIIKLIRDKK